MHKALGPGFASCCHYAVYGCDCELDQGASLSLMCWLLLQAVLRSNQEPHPDPQLLPPAVGPISLHKSMMECTLRPTVNSSCSTSHRDTLRPLSPAASYDVYSPQPSDSPCSSILPNSGLLLEGRRLVTSGDIQGFMA